MSGFLASCTRDYRLPVGVRLRVLSGGALLLLAFALPACHAAGPPAAGARAGVPRAARIVLERFPCRGGCPVYSVSIDSVGHVEFHGLAHVSHLGESTARVPAAHASALLAYGDSVFTGGLDPRYAYGTAQCGTYVADLPEVAVTLVGEGTTTTVQVDFGCEAVPQGKGAVMVAAARSETLSDGGPAAA